MKKNEKDDEPKDDESEEKRDVDDESIKKPTKKRQRSWNQKEPKTKIDKIVKMIFNATPPPETLSIISKPDDIEVVKGVVDFKQHKNIVGYYQQKLMLSESRVEHYQKQIHDVIVESIQTKKGNLFINILGNFRLN
jgi:hypothetical protein